MMSRRTIRIVAVVLALVAGVSGALGYNFVDDKTSESGAESRPKNPSIAFLICRHHKDQDGRVFLEPNPAPYV